ncbi:MAG: hypothetical protein A2W31_17295 [Planctomycetes bacterium RBG_16_64_10]|nr:MAG: hypothetical protein A2W31_17295 [Planctomycetes bacterium RBG_16_64_10]
MARIDHALPGLEIDPPATQVRAATLVVVHLRPADLRSQLPDVNTRNDPEDRGPPIGSAAGSPANARRLLNTGQPNGVRER